MGHSGSAWSPNKTLNARKKKTPTEDHSKHKSILRFNDVHRHNSYRCVDMVGHMTTDKATGATTVLPDHYRSAPENAVNIQRKPRPQMVYKSEL